MPPKMRLVYFNIRGRGELIRLALHAGSVDFQDERIEYADWPVHKSNAPNGILPYIEANGQKFGEVLPLVRFVAKKCNMLGKDDTEQLYADIVITQMDGIRDAWARYKTDPILRKDQKKYLENKMKSETLPQLLNKMETGLTVSQTGYLLGNDMTIADLALFDLVDAALIDTPTLLASFPNLADHRTKLMAHPKLSPYLKSRPVTKR